MVKFLGMDFKRPPPTRKAPNDKITKNIPKFRRDKPEYETQVHVHAYKHRKVKTFTGSTARAEARVLISKMREKDPRSKYSIKVEKVPRKRFL